MRKPLCIDLFCGLGGWTEGFLAEGYDVVGFDIERHQYGDARYPAQLVLQDVLTLHGSQFRNAAVIVASPPCQKYSYMAMPWSRAKEIAAGYRAEPARQVELNALFNACFRIAKEASVPLVIENVKGAQPWVGSARWHYGSFYLWGDVPALMPPVLRTVKGTQPRGEERPNGTGSTSWFFGTRSDPRDSAGSKATLRSGIKNEGTAGGSWFNIAHGQLVPGNQAGAPQRGDGLKAAGLKNPGMNWSKSNEPGYKAVGFNVSNAQRFRERTKQAGLSGAAWFDHGDASHSSRSDSRKAASAMIAKIPFELSSHIARCFYPR